MLGPPLLYAHRGAPHHGRCRCGRNPLAPACKPTGCHLSCYGGPIGFFPRVAPATMLSLLKPRDSLGRIREGPSHTVRTLALTLRREVTQFSVKRVARAVRFQKRTECVPRRPSLVWRC